VNNHFEANAWLGDEDSLLAYIDAERRILDMSAAELREGSRTYASDSSREDEDEFGEYGYMVSRADNLAVINISGSLVSSDSFWNRMMGRVSYNEIRGAVFASLEAGVDGIMLNLDTPGGDASGISDLGAFLREVDARVKPVYSYSGTKMNSGGYWLGSVGREIYVSQLASIGSIGVVTVHASIQKMLKDRGVEVTVLRAGEFKALGSPFEKLDEKARAQIQAQLDTIYGVFLDTVAEHRGMTVSALKANAAEGRLFIGAEAVAVGLADHVTSFDRAVSAVSEKVRASASSLPRQSFGTTQQTGEPMAKRKVLTEAAVAALASGATEAELLADPTMVVEVSDEGEGTPVAPAAAEASESTDPLNPAQVAAPAAAAPAEADQNNMLSTLLDRLTAATNETADLRAKLSSAEKERDQAKSVEASLARIAVSSINRMQVALGGAVMKLEDADTSTILEMHNRALNSFNQRFPKGASAQVPTDKDAQSNADPAPVNRTVDAAVQRLTTARVAHQSSKE